MKIYVLSESISHIVKNKDKTYLVIRHKRNDLNKIIYDVYDEDGNEIKDMKLKKLLMETVEACYVRRKN